MWYGGQWSQSNRSIFISDFDNKCIWRIQMPNKEISRWEIDGRPWGLSINSSDELIVVVHRDGRYYIDVYRCEDGGRIKRIDIDYVVRGEYGLYALPVVQSSNGNFIIVHRNRYDDPRVYLIREVSIDGTKIIRSFDPRSTKSNESKGLVALAFVNRWRWQHIRSWLSKTTELFCWILDWTNIRFFWTEINIRSIDQRNFVMYERNKCWSLVMVGHRRQLRCSLFPSIVRRHVWWTTRWSRRLLYPFNPHTSDDNNYGDDDVGDNKKMLVMMIIWHVWWTTRWSHYHSYFAIQPSTYLIIMRRGRR